MDGVILSIIEIILLGLGLAMDASAVSMTNGMTMKPMKLKGTLATAFAFGLFQGVMPLIGYFAGSVFAGYMAAVDHWIALILLGFIGGKMLWDALKKEEEIVPVARKLTFKLLLVQAIATSIDALAVGVSFAAMNVNIFIAVSIIAAITFACSMIAVLIGKKCGDFLNQKAELFGGCILILIGLKIFLDGIGFFG